jgi:hypothetical protein
MLEQLDKNSILIILVLYLMVIATDENPIKYRPTVLVLMAGFLVLRVLQEFGIIPHLGVGS